MTSETKKHPDSARAQARRQQILNAAELCFARKGFHGASMAEISQAAEMSAGHIYNYFESKEAIIGAIAEQHIEALFAHKDDTLASQITAHLNDCHDSAHIALMFDIMAEALRNPKMTGIVTRFDAQAQAQFEKTCAKQFSLPPEEITQRVRILRAALFGLSTLKICHPDSTDRDKIAMINIAIEKLFNPVY